MQVLNVEPHVFHSSALHDLQRWQPLCVLMTSDTTDIRQVLASAAHHLCTASDAHGCVLTYAPPARKTIQVQHGDVTDELRAALRQIETTLCEDMEPLHHTHAGLFVTSVPLCSAGSYIGAMHLVDPEPGLDPLTLQLVATLLTQALQQRRGSEAVASSDLIRREMEVRAQIARDLHDGPVQQIAVAVVEVQYARRIAQRSPEQLLDILDDLQEHLRRVTHDVRTVLYELRPLGIVEEGLVPVLQQYVERLRMPNTRSIHFDASPDVRRLNPDQEAAIFMIVQEAINNIRKHAAAGDVWVVVREDDHALCVTVRDNGRGFDLAAVEATYIRRGSFGLLNMRERAQLIGGECTIRSEPGRGPRVEIRIPYPRF